MHYVQQIRNKLGMTQKEFAERCRVTWLEISRWENGHNEPNKQSQYFIEKLRKEAGI